MYWSTKDARRRCIYTCRIVEVRPAAMKSPTITIKDTRVVHDKTHPEFVPFSSLDLMQHSLKASENGENKSLTICELSESTKSALENDDGDSFSRTQSDYKMETIFTDETGDSKALKGDTDGEILDNANTTSKRSNNSKPMARSSGFGCLPLKVDGKTEKLSSSWPQSKFSSRSDLSFLSPNTLKMLNIKDRSKYIKPIKGHESEKSATMEVADDDLSLLKIADRLNTAAARNFKKPGSDGGSSPRLITMSPSSVGRLISNEGASLSPIGFRDDKFTRVHNYGNVPLRDMLCIRPFSPPYRMMARSRSLSVDTEKHLSRPRLSIKELTEPSNMDTDSDAGSANVAVLSRGRSVSDPISPLKPVHASSPLVTRTSAPIDKTNKLSEPQTSTENIDTEDNMDTEVTSYLESDSKDGEKNSDVNVTYSASAEMSLTTDNERANFSEINHGNPAKSIKATDESTQSENYVSQEDLESADTIVVMTESGESVSDEDALKIVQEVLEQNLLKIEAKMSTDNGEAENETEGNSESNDGTEVDNETDLTNNPSSVPDADTPNNSVRTDEDKTETNDMADVTDTTVDNLESCLFNEGKPGSPFVPDLKEAGGRSSLNTNIRRNSIETFIHHANPKRNRDLKTTDTTEIADSANVKEPVNKTQEPIKLVNQIQNTSAIQANSESTVDKEPIEEGETMTEDDNLSVSNNESHEGVLANNLDKGVDEEKETEKMEDKNSYYVGELEDNQEAVISVDSDSSFGSDIMDITDSVTKGKTSPENQAAATELSENDEQDKNIPMNDSDIEMFDEDVDSDIELLDQTTDSNAKETETKAKTNHNSTVEVNGESNSENENNGEHSSKDEIDGEQTKQITEKANMKMKCENETKPAVELSDKREEVEKGKAVISNDSVKDEILVNGILDDETNLISDSAEESADVKEVIDSSKLPVLDPIAKKIKEESIAKSCPGEMGPFKCKNCRRMYRTESSYTIHIENCNFCLSSSDEDSNSCDGPKVVDQVEMRVTRSRKDQNSNVNLEKIDINEKREDTDDSQSDTGDDKKVRSSLRQSTVNQRLALESEAKRMKEEHNITSHERRGFIGNIEVQENGIEEDGVRHSTRRLSATKKDITVEADLKEPVQKRGRGRQSLNKKNDSNEQTDPLSNHDKGDENTDTGKEKNLEGHEGMSAEPRRGRGRPKKVDTAVSSETIEGKTRMTRSISQDSLRSNTSQSEGEDIEIPTDKQKLEDEVTKLAELVNRKRSMGKSIRSLSSESSSGDDVIKSPVAKRRSMQEKKEQKHELSSDNGDGLRKNVNNRSTRSQRLSRWNTIEICEETVEMNKSSDNDTEDMDVKDGEAKNDSANKNNSFDENILDPESGYIVNSKTGKFIIPSKGNEDTKGNAEQDKQIIDETVANNTDAVECEGSNQELETEQVKDTSDPKDNPETEKEQHEADQETNNKEKQEDGKSENNAGTEAQDVPVNSGTKDTKGIPERNNGGSLMGKDGLETTLQQEVKKETKNDHDDDITGNKDQCIEDSAKDTYVNMSEKKETDDGPPGLGSLPDTVLKLLNDGHKVVIKNPKTDSNFIWQKTENGFMGKPFLKGVSSPNVRTICHNKSVNVSSKTNKQSEPEHSPKANIESRAQVTNQSASVDSKNSSMNSNGKSKSVSDQLYEKIRRQNAQIQDAKIEAHAKFSDANTMNMATDYNFNDSFTTNSFNQNPVQNFVSPGSMIDGSKMGFPGLKGEYLGGLVLSSQKNSSFSSCQQVVHQTVSAATLAFQNSLQMRNTQAMNMVLPLGQNRMIGNGSSQQNILSSILPSSQIQILQQQQVPIINQVQSSIPTFASTTFSSGTSYQQGITCLTPQMGTPVGSVAQASMPIMGMMTIPVQHQIIPLQSNNGAQLPGNIAGYQQCLPNFNLMTSPPSGSAFNSITTVPVTSSPFVNPVMHMPSTPYAGLTSLLAQNQAINKTVNLMGGNPTGGVNLMGGNATSGVNLMGANATGGFNVTMNAAPPTMSNSSSTSMPCSVSSLRKSPKKEYMVKKQVYSIKPGLGGGSSKLFDKMKSIIHKRNRISSAKKVLEKQSSSSILKVPKMKSAAMEKWGEKKAKSPRKKRKKYNKRKEKLVTLDHLRPHTTGEYLMW